MIAALFADRKSPEQWSALSAVKLQQGCNYTTCRILTLTSKLKLILYLDTYAQTETSTSIEDVASLALAVLSLIPSFGFLHYSW